MKKPFPASSYLLVFVLPVSAFFSFLAGYPFTFIPVLYAFVLIPMLELILRPDRTNLESQEEELAGQNPVYDWFLYLQLPLQYVNLLLFLKVCTAAGDGVTLFSMILLMGLLCGVIGINVAHELGHRSSRTEQFLAKSLLLSSLYMHFFIEHNRGHHKRVATHEDPASARYGESIYAFWGRSLWYSYISAWHLEKQRLQKQGLFFWSIYNEMIIYHLLQAALLIAVYLVFGLKVMLCFMAAALIGSVLLESVNYIEHYGLSRQKREDGSYAKTLQCHSWNSDHVIGRLVLFELSRHSDHHHKASKKYQTLRHWDESPQMPTGYPGMIILALFPPLWFRVIHPILDREMQRMPEIVIAR